MLASCAVAALPSGAYAAPHAVSSYTLSVFATAPAGLSAPDSIALVGGHVFVGYGDGHAPDGSDGKNSQIVEYTMAGKPVHTYIVHGHSDGLKVDPATGNLWALQNEDANAHLVIIDPVTQKTTLYQFGKTLHGGGYDDIVFLNGRVFISASNPAKTAPNTGPAIVSVTLGKGTVAIESVLAGDAQAIDLVSAQTTKLNLTDPDSMTSDPLGNLVLDSQGDQELIIVSNPGESTQSALRLRLRYWTSAGLRRVEVDDTTFVTSSQGFILFADKKLNTVYKLERPAFAPGSAYTAADGGPFVGTIDLTSGVITPVVKGLSNPGGLVFVDTSTPVPSAH
jgi:hypothetical protein